MIDKLDTPFGPLGYITFKRTYARKLKDTANSPTEEFEQMIDRQIKACRTQLKVDFTLEEEAEIKGLLMSLKCLLAGRFFWQLGTSTVDRLGLMSLQNCAAVVVNEPIRPFTWAMDALMLGCVPPNTKILVDSGVKRISDIHKGDRVYSYNKKDNKIELSCVTDIHKISVAKSDNIKISGNYGSFVTSKHHPVLCLRGGTWDYLPAGKLVLGDVVKKAAFRNDEKTWNKKAWFSGAFLGDGCSNFNNYKCGSFRIRLTKDNEELVRSFCSVSHDLYKTSNFYRTSDIYSVPAWITEKSVAEEYKEDFQNTIGREIGGEKSATIEVPRWVLESSNINIFASFLAGLIDSDGWAVNTKVFVCSSSRILIDQLLDICPKFGFYPWLKIDTPRGFSGKPAKEGQAPCYTLGFSVFDFWGYAEFFRNDKKRSIIEQGLRARKWCGKQPVTVPRCILEEERAKLLLEHRDWHFRAKALRDGFVGKSYYHRTGFPVEHLLQYDTIISIEDNLPIDENFLDLTVEGNHSYLAGEGSYYVLHNCGVGYNIQRENVYQLPKIKKCKIARLDTNDADFIVPDSREGWVKLLEEVLKSHFISGKGFSYSTVCVRSKGALIKGFGGIASGPEELCWGMDQISKILNNRAGKKLRSVDALDIMNIIGFVVVSGNVRRSAQIAIGDMDDLLFLQAKRWDLGNIPNWRAMSNNSVICNDINNLPEQFWNGYNGNGEPYGLINLKLSQETGRLGETNYPDPEVAAYNPCCEQPLANFETCCLAEIVLPNVKSKEELVRISKYLYRINKHSLSLPCHSLETQNIVHKNMRMGIGVTGYLQASSEQRSWLSDVYLELRKYDEEYSKQHGWPRSIKLTTVKPSGTLSLIPGVTPGIHPGYSRYFIRRIRIAANSELVEVCRKNGYHIEFQKNFDGSDDKNTVVVSFPCSYPESAVLAKDVTAMDQLNWIKKAQTEWSDNAVSCTVYYKKEELPAIRTWLKENYNTSTKTVSFLLHKEHGFSQAPFEEITEEMYLLLISKVSAITSVEVREHDLSDSYECEGGQCPIR